VLRSERGEVTKGAIQLAERRIDGMPAHEVAKLGLVQVFEGRRVFENLTTEENLIAGGHRAERRVGQAGHRHGLHLLSAPARTARSARRLPVGRRAADAGDRPGAHE
jgi:ABC-type branched-subunit amino acid transport system ATPase component